MHKKEAIRRYAKNSNGFLTLYEGYQTFDAEGGGSLSYVESGSAWVGATEPLAEPHRISEVLSQFVYTAVTQKKSALILPVDRTTMEKAKGLGFKALQIGTEPYFDLMQYQPQWHLPDSSRGLKNKGARVEEFRPEKIPAAQKNRCNELLKEWLGTRKMAPLSFLNRVEPWNLAEEKRYFWIQHEGQIWAYIAAVPIWSRNGWYFVDLIRSPEAPIGATELLMLEAMGILKKEGAKEISLGVAPLAELPKGEKGIEGAIYTLLRFVFNRVDLFYRFKSLYQFKEKFQPSRKEESYLIYYPPNLSPITLLGLLGAFVPTGVGGAVGSWLTRKSYRLPRLEKLKPLLSKNRVPLPLSWGEGIKKITFSLLFSVPFILSAPKWEWPFFLLVPLVELFAGSIPVVGAVCVSLLLGLPFFAVSLGMLLPFLKKRIAVPFALLVGLVHPLAMPAILSGFGLYLIIEEILNRGGRRSVSHS